MVKKRRLDRLLSDSAKECAQRAIAAYSAGETADFHLFAGMALEHAMKSKLAALNVAFLAPSGNAGAATAIQLWQLRKDAESIPTKVSTVGAAEAVNRVKILDNEFSRHEKAVRHLLACRNAQAHLGYVAPVEKLHDEFAWLVKSISALMREDYKSETFWGEHERLVAVTLDEQANEVTRDVEMKKTNARAQLAQIPGEIHTFARGALDAKGESTNTLWYEPDSAVREDCPVCGYPASLGGEFGVTGERTGLDDYEVYVEFVADDLDCPVCGLSLEGYDELEAVGIEVTRVVDDPEIADRVMSDYYEDDYH